MYASVSKYLGYGNEEDDNLNQTNLNQTKLNLENYEKKQETKPQFSKNKPTISRPVSRPVSRQVPKKSLKELVTGQKEGFINVNTNSESDNLTLTWKEEDGLSTVNPKVWGPAFWFYLHTSSAYYPENPSKIVRDRMKSRILAIPYELPCASCRQHAIAFIESNREKLDDIVSSNQKLFNFYVDFHNQVNARYGKKEWTYDEARALYTGQASLRYLSY
jgi:hypothetical protein